MSTFYCEGCKLTFENNQGLKKEYKDFIYGPCWKYIAYCPECNQECSQKPAPKPGKAKSDLSNECSSGGCYGPSCNRF